MQDIIFKKGIAVGLLIVFILSSCVPAFGLHINNTTSDEALGLASVSDVKYIELEFSFSDPEVVRVGNYWVVRVMETNHNRYTLFDWNPGKPVLPVNITVSELVFGSKILDVSYENSTPEIIDLPGIVAYCKASYDTLEYGQIEITQDLSIYESSEPYPSDWVSYHTGGGLYQGERSTFLVTRVYPVRYYPLDDQLQFIRTITVNISYSEPATPVIDDNSIYDLLIITPSNFHKHLEPLVDHKNKFGVRTKLISLDYVYDHIWYGRDRAEKIKLFIKESIEKAGVKYVLLVGGLKGQTFRWNIPIRYSRVVPTEEQEWAEPFFISDLYYADIYDSLGGFSSWDSNDDNIFSKWNESFKEEMDLYPDVYLGRLDCRSKREVKIMVDKIINYEKDRCAEEDWFNNLILVAGDSYNDTAHYNEGELISEEAIRLMPDFNPVRVYAREGEDINRETVNDAMNAGGGFAYFCGHGSINTWSTHFPPDGKKWTKGYDCKDMLFLKNKYKLPIGVVGGCHNGQFDVSLRYILKGIRDEGLRYFKQAPNPGSFWYPKLWFPNCWAWWLTSERGGGTIATIANTGLGTHGDGDIDNNTICDYLEILDGWLELNFLKLYGMDGKDILGENHGDSITGYLHRFLGDDTKMDVKMVQQWELFGDPSLKIGGYD